MRTATTRPLRRLTGLLFCLPFLALVAVFVAAPLVRVVRLSFTHYDGLSPATPVGLANYEFLLHWQDFHRVLLNNAVLVLGVALWVAVPFIVSIIVFRLRSADAIRAVLFIPALLPPIIVGGVFRVFLADDGVVNSVLRSIGLGALAPPWLSGDKTVLVTIILVIAWATMGSGILFYSSGLSAMSPSYVEAAVVDGASWWQLVWHIYRPALRPVTRFWILLLTVTTVTGFFPWIYGLTQGGPGFASTTLDYAVFVTLNQGDTLGRGAAIAVVSLGFVGIVILLQVLGRRLRADQDWAR